MKLLLYANFMTYITGKPMNSPFGTLVRPPPMFQLTTYQIRRYVLGQLKITIY